MKFEYDSKSVQRECVAYIDKDGDLLVMDDDGAILLGQDGTHLTAMEWNPSEATRKFYPGDKLTITF